MVIMENNQVSNSKIISWYENELLKNQNREELFKKLCNTYDLKKDKAYRILSLRKLIPKLRDFVISYRFNELSIYNIAFLDKSQQEELYSYLLNNNITKITVEDAKKIKELRKKFDIKELEFLINENDFNYFLAVKIDGKYQWLKKYSQVKNTYELSPIHRMKFSNYSDVRKIRDKLPKIGFEIVKDRKKFSNEIHMLSDIYDYEKTLNATKIILMRYGSYIKLSKNEKIDLRNKDVYDSNRINYSDGFIPRYTFKINRFIGNEEMIDRVNQTFIHLSSTFKEIYRDLLILKYVYLMTDYQILSWDNYNVYFDSTEDLQFEINEAIYLFGISFGCAVEKGK